jgi:hypothetical protein
MMDEDKGPLVDEAAAREKWRGREHPRDNRRTRKDSPSQEGGTWTGKGDEAKTAPQTPVPPD